MIHTEDSCACCAYSRFSAVENCKEKANLVTGLAKCKWEKLPTHKYTARENSHTYTENPCLRYEFMHRCEILSWVAGRIKVSPPGEKTGALKKILDAWYRSLIYNIQNNRQWFDITTWRTAPEAPPHHSIPITGFTPHHQLNQVTCSPVVSSRLFL